MKWGLEGVKVGDLLVVSYGFHGEELAKVDKVLKTYVQCGKNRYRIKNGAPTNAGTWNRVHAHIATDADIERIRAEAGRRRIEELVSRQGKGRWPSTVMREVYQKLESTMLPAESK